MRILSDNAANIMKAFRLQVIDSKKPIPNKKVTADFREELTSGDVDEMRDVETTHIRCFCRTVQICAKDGLKHCPTYTNISRAKKSKQYHKS